MRFPRSFPLLRCAAALFFGLAAPGGIGRAATATWLASSGAGSWNTAANWSTGLKLTGSDNVVVSGSAGTSAWTITGMTIEIQDFTYSLSSLDRRLRNDSTSADSILAFNGTGANGGLLINLTTARFFSLQAVGSGGHLLSVQLNTSGTFNSNGTAADATLGGSGLVVNAPVTESGGGRSLTLTGSGTVTLGGSNSYSGGTFVAMSGNGSVLLSGTSADGSFTGVNSGTLVVSGRASGAVTVGGGTLRGTGSTGEISVMSGTVAPGTDAATGILHAGSLDLRGGAHLAVRLGGTTAGTGYDQVATTGGITLNGDLQGSLINGFTPAGATFNQATGHFNLDGAMFFIVLGTAHSGTFTNAEAADPGLPGYGTITFGGQRFALSYTGNMSTNSFAGGNDTVLMAIPEPATCMLLIGGMGMLAACAHPVSRRIFFSNSPTRNTTL